MASWENLWCYRSLKRLRVNALGLTHLRRRLHGRISSSCIETQDPAINRGLSTQDMEFHTVHVNACLCQIFSFSTEVQTNEIPNVSHHVQRDRVSGTGSVLTSYLQYGAPTCWSCPTCRQIFKKMDYSHAVESDKQA